MKRRTTNVSTPIAHLVGPGKLKVTNGQLAYRSVMEGETPFRLDPEKLEAVYCYGSVSVSDDAIDVLLSGQQLKLGELIRRVSGAVLVEAAERSIACHALLEHGYPALCERRIAVHGLHLLREREVRILENLELRGREARRRRCDWLGCGCRILGD